MTTEWQEAKMEARTTAICEFVKTLPKLDETLDFAPPMSLHVFECFACYTWWNEHLEGKVKAMQAAGGRVVEYMLNEYMVSYHASHIAEGALNDADPAQ